MSESIDRELQGRVAVVTGAGRGLGWATAQILAAHGALLAILDVTGDEDRAAASLVEAGRDAVALNCDVSDPSAVDRSVASVRERFGRCDILINNAGTVTPPGPLAEVTFEDWARVVGVNLHGTFLCTKGFGAMMLEQRRGAIVSVASLAGVIGQPGRGAYGATKAAIIDLMKEVAVEWGPRGIRANAVSPGLLDNRVGGRPSRLADLTLVPLGRMGELREVAEAIAFLASDRASFITGENVVLDGGLSHVMLDLVQRTSRPAQ